jgi:hypothetical protein
MCQTTEREFIEQVRLNIKAKKIDEAAKISSEALRLYPGSERLNMQHGIILQMSGANLAAREHFESLLNSYPDVAELEVRLASIALANDDVAEFERRLEAAIAKNGEQGVIQGLRADLARRNGDIYGECALLEAVVDEADRLPIGRAVRLANVYSQINENGRALQVLQRVIDIAPTSIGAYSALANIARAMGDELLEESTLLRLIELAPYDPKWYGRVQELYLDLGQPEKAEEFLRAGISKGLFGTHLFGRLTAFPPFADLAEPVVQWARSIGDDASEREWDLAQFVLFHYASLDCSENKEGTAPSAGRPSRLGDWLALSPAGDDLKRSVALEPLNNDIQISRATGSDCVVLVFLGLANQAMLPTPIFDRFLAALGVTALYIQDRNRQLGNAGVLSAGESFDATVRYLRETISALGGKRCVTIGSSAGGFAAIRYGLELGAEIMLSFAGPTNVTAEFMENDGRAKTVIRRLQKFPRHMLDIRPQILAASGRGEVHIVYGELHSQDRMHAEYLRDCPGVHLHPLVDSAEHESIRTLVRQSKLFPMLCDLIGEYA